MLTKIPSTLLCVCSTIDHRWHQNVVRTKKGGTDGGFPDVFWPQFLQTSSSPTARQGPFPLVLHITLLLSSHLLPLNESDRCKICFRVNPALFTTFIFKLVFSLSLFQLVPVVARREATVSKPPLSLNKSPSLSFSLGISPSSSTFLVWVTASHH